MLHNVWGTQPQEQAWSLSCARRPGDQQRRPGPVTVTVLVPAGCQQPVVLHVTVQQTPQASSTSENCPPPLKGAIAGYSRL
eukprot:3257105-Rhodomonas_salina.1